MTEDGLTVNHTTESPIVTACLALLHVRGFVALRVNSGAVVLGEGKSRRFVRMIRGEEGVSDIIAMQPPQGRFWAVEVKVPGRKPTAQQRAFLRKVEAGGGVGCWVTSVRELEQIIDDVEEGK